jgi:hypothetical protein
MFDPDEELPPRRRPLREIAPVAVTVLAVVLIIIGVTLRLAGPSRSGAVDAGASSGDRPLATPAPRASSGSIAGPIIVAREPITTQSLAATSRAADRAVAQSATPADPRAPASSARTTPPSGDIPPAAPTSQIGLRPARSPSPPAPTPMPVPATAAPAATAPPPPPATTPGSVPPQPAAATAASAPPQPEPTQPAPPPTSTPAPGPVDDVIDTATDLLGLGR